MKKIICFFVMISIGFVLFAFDRSLNGSWGLVMSSEKQEFIRFNTNEIIIMDKLFRSNDYEETDDTIYLSDLNDDSVVIQYYRLSTDKLLFIMWNIDRPEESINLILSKL